MLPNYPHLQRYNERTYLRLNGKKIRLHSEKNTVAFHREYLNAYATLHKPKEQIQGWGDRTLGWLVERYMASDYFKSLEPDSQFGRRKSYEQMLREPYDNTHVFGDLPIAKITSRHVEILRDRKVRQGMKSAANNRLKHLHRLFEWAIDQNYLTKNPASKRHVHKIKNLTDGYHTLTIDELNQYRSRHPLGTMARLAGELAWNLGQRATDISLFGPRHIVNGRIAFTQFKNRNNTYRRDLTLPLLPGLKQAIASTKVGEKTFLINRYGVPFTRKGIVGAFRNWFDEAGLPRASAHSFRKGFATFLAENGATEYQLCAVFGFTPVMARIYTKKADQGRTADSIMLRVHQQPVAT